MKKLVIVESPAKAKTINKILGKDYVVKASMGHVRDLPEGRFGVDIENGFAPQYVPIKSRQKIITELRAAAKTSDEIFLAPDPDREGEAIAWHLHELLKTAAGKKTPFSRVTYNEITATALRRAFEHPRQIDSHKVDAQQARRVLDRLVGYRVSPMLWRRVSGGSSAGRVQSVALRLVCEREQAIRDFKPEEYWILGAKVAKRVDPRDAFTVRLARINGEKAEVKTSAQAEQVRTDLEGRDLRVSNILTRETTRRAPPPFITSSLQQAASRVARYSPSRTMRLAQSLYEGMDFGQGPVGLITYMRTDSVAIAKEAQEAARAFIGTTFGPAFVPEKPPFYKSRGSAQEAHEAIRPTDVHRTPQSLEGHLKPDELKLYRLIWERFVASQMSPARIGQRTAEIEAPPPAGAESTYLFRATASEVLFPGYLRLTGVEAVKPKPDAPREDGAETAEEEAVEVLPPLDVGEVLDRLDWLADQKFTQPPPRYSEATLVKALEENGIGRPSTYAQTLSTLLAREYVEKEKYTLKPTAAGERVWAFLGEHLPALFDIQFTARMEEQLDEIEEGRVVWTHMMQEFNGRLGDWIKVARGPDADAGLVGRLLDLLGQVKTWPEPRKAGRRTYSDEKFVASVRKQVEEGKPLSERQLDALRKVASRYREQVPELEAQAEALGLASAGEDGGGAGTPPQVMRKLEVLGQVKEWAPARKVGRRTYDDQAFVQSLREQAEGGRTLSPAQTACVDRMVNKYKAQIPEFGELDMSASSAPGGEADPNAAAQIESLLKAFQAVTEWKAPVERRGRTWNDKEFFDSLSRQFAEKKNLSPRQLGALRKMAARYKLISKDGDATPPPAPDNAD